MPGCAAGPELSQGRQGVDHADRHVDPVAPLDAAQLTKAGFPPKRVHTNAGVHFDKVGDGFSITSIDLTTEAEVPGIENTKFQELADGAKKGCPVSRALAGTQINLKATLAKTAGV